MINSNACFACFAYFNKIRGIPPDRPRNHIGQPRDPLVGFASCTAASVKIACSVK
jgi:hypothetical protein